MIDLTRSLVIAAPPPAVWAVLAAYDRDPEWRTGVLAMAADPSGRAEPGTTTREALRLGGRTYVNDGVVDSVEDSRRLTWHTVEGADASGSRLVEAGPDGTSRVTLALLVRPHGVDRLIAPVVRRLLDRNLRRDLAALAALVAADERSAAVRG